jgi:phosphopantothenate---cysteine ligase (CTP)
VIVLAAAVSDYDVANYVDGKIRSKDSLEIKLKPLPKIISTIRAKQPQAYFVGFKLLVNSTDEELIAAAQESLKSNGCDMVVANDLRDIQQNNHRLLIVTPNNIVIKTKGEQVSSLASVLVDQIIENVNGWRQFKDAR